MSIDSLALHAQQARMAAGVSEAEQLGVKAGGKVLGNGPEAKAMQDKRLRESCENFEAIFVKQLFKEMRNTVHEGGMFSSKEEAQWRDMLDDELAKSMSKSQSMGLADMLYAQMRTKLEEAGKGLPSQRAEAGEAKAVTPLPGRSPIELTGLATPALHAIGTAAEPAASLQQAGVARPDFDMTKAVSGKAGENSGPLDLAFLQPAVNAGFRVAPMVSEAATANAPAGGVRGKRKAPALGAMPQAPQVPATTGKTAKGKTDQTAEAVATPSAPEIEVPRESGQPGGGAKAVSQTGPELELVKAVQATAQMSAQIAGLSARQASVFSREDRDS